MEAEAVAIVVCQSVGVQTGTASADISSASIETQSSCQSGWKSSSAAAVILGGITERMARMAR